MQSLESVRDTGVRSLGDGARQLLQRFQWCKGILRADVGFALPGRFGVFRFEIEPSGPAVPTTVWVVFGDLAPAYLAGPALTGWREVLAAYVEKMGRWVVDVLRGGDGADLIPINIEASASTAMALQKRLEFIRDTLLADPTARMPEV